MVGRLVDYEILLYQHPHNSIYATCSTLGCIETEVRRECVKAISNQRVQRSVTGDTYEAPWDYSAEQLDTRCKPQLGL